MKLCGLSNLSVVNCPTDLYGIWITDEFACIEFAFLIYGAIGWSGTKVTPKNWNDALGTDINHSTLATDSDRVL